MATFLTVNGYAVPVMREGAEESEPEQIGDRARSLDGTMWSSVSVIKRQWKVETGPLLPGEVDTIVAMAGNGLGPVIISGDMLNNSGALVYITISNRKYISDGTVDGFFLQLTLEMSEV